MADTVAPETTQQPTGWDKYPYVYQDVPPPESTFEHIAKAFGALGAAHGLPSIRSKQDMWFNYQKGKNAGNTAAVSQEAGDVARSEEEVGLPRTRAYYEAQRYAEAPEIARQNALIRKANLERQQAGEKRLEENQRSLNTERNIQNYTRFAPTVRPGASFSEANEPWRVLGNTQDFPSRTIGQTSSTATGNDMIAEAAGGMNPVERTAAGLDDLSVPIREPILPTPKNRSMTIEEAQQDISDRGQDGSEVVVWNPAHNSYEPKQKTVSNSMDLAKLHIHAIELNHELDGIAKERRALLAPKKGTLTPAVMADRDAQLVALDTRRKNATDELHELIGYSSDLSSAVDHARKTGEAAGRTVQPPKPEEPRDQAVALGELTEDEVAIVKDEAEQGRSREEIADILSRRRRGMQNANAR